MRHSYFGILSFVLVSCGGTKAPDDSAGLPAHGVAIFDGRPAGGAVLLFHGSGAGLPPRTLVQTDGKFEVPSAGGLSEGQYTVSVEWRTGSDENGGVRKSIVPDKYTRKESSPLKATVKVGPDGQCDLGTLTITK